MLTWAARVVTLLSSNFLSKRAIVEADSSLNASNSLRSPALSLDIASNSFWLSILASESWEFRSCGCLVSLPLQSGIDLGEGLAFLSDNSTLSAPDFCAAACWHFAWIWVAKSIKNNSFHQIWNLWVVLLAHSTFYQCATEAIGSILNVARNPTSLKMSFAFKNARWEWHSSPSKIK